MLPARKISAAGFKRPGLIATRYTMEEEFYVGRLQSLFGLDVIVPENSDRDEVHRVIYDELCKGIVNNTSRATYRAIAERLIKNGADCPHSWLYGSWHVAQARRFAGARLFDTTHIHAEAAVELADRKHDCERRQNNHDRDRCPCWNGSCCRALHCSLHF